MNINELLELRVKQVETITDAEREELDETNPIIHAETAPNRFNVMTLFFTDSDGVKIEEDLDLNEITVQFFTDTETLDVTTGPLFEWAIDYYKSN